jgi:hypothetical protein
MQTRKRDEEGDRTYERQHRGTASSPQGFQFHYQRVQEEMGCLWWQQEGRGETPWPPGDEEEIEGLRVDFYLVVFLKFIASIVPTIEVDSTTAF